MPHTLMKDGTEIYYRITGDGFPVVFIHGFQWSADMWKKQEHVFAKRYKVIAYDLRGLGLSSKPLADIYPATLHAEDLDTLLTELKIEKVAIVGCSMGGCVAQQYYLDHPKKVAALILFGAFASGKAFIPHEIDDMTKELVDTAAGRSRMAIKICLTDRFLKYSPDADETTAMTQEEAGRTTNVAALWANYRGFMEFDVRDHLPEMEVPTLVICGEQDMPTPPKAAKYLKDHIPEARLVMLPGGHHLCIEEATRFNEAVLEFLEEHIKYR